MEQTSEPAKPRRRRASWLAAAAILIVIAGIAVFVVTRPSTTRSTSSAHPVTPPNVPEIVHDAIGGDQQLYRITGYAPALIETVPGRPRALEVSIPHAERYRNGDGSAVGPVHSCDFFAPHLAVTQNAQQIRIVLSGWQYLPLGIRKKNPNYHCSTFTGTTMRVNLAAPVGDRPLYTGHNKTPFLLTDPDDTATAHALPAGYHFTHGYSVKNSERANERVYFRPNRTTCANTRQRCDGSGLSFAAGPAGTFQQVYATSPPIRHVTVRGRPAILQVVDVPATNTTIECVTWREQASQRGRQVCFDGMHSDHFTTADLLEQANAYY